MYRYGSIKRIADDSSLIPRRIMVSSTISGNFKCCLKFSGMWGASGVNQLRSMCGILFIDLTYNSLKSKSKGLTPSKISESSSNVPASIPRSQSDR